MKMLYIAPTIIEMDKLDGVAKKILSQVHTLSSRYEVELLYRDAKSVMLYNTKTDSFNVIQDGKSKYDIMKSAFEIIKYHKINYSYIRYPYSDILFLALLKKMKNMNIRTVIEIPTYPYEAEGRTSLRGRVIQVLDKIFRKKLKKYVDRIVTYSDDKMIFGIKTINTINGIDFSKVTKSVELQDLREIHLCGVATLCAVNGYDRLIEGLKNYYASGGNKKVVFDVVGYGDEKYLCKYKELVKKYHLEENVVFHGRLCGEQLDKIYNKATIGVNSLAIHRHNLVRESTLKTREYAAKGLPILSSCFVDALSEKDNNEFVCRVPANESPIDMDLVINFYEKLALRYKGKNIKTIIRLNSQKICDMPVAMMPIIEYFSNTEKQNDNVV